MQLQHSFSLPADVDEAWRVLTDIQRVARCMPGAALDSVDGDDFTGSVKVKLGPIGLTYKGKARFVEKNEKAHRVVLDARGKEARGNGTAVAKVTAKLVRDGTGTRIEVLTDLNMTGRPTQFGRGVMVDVGNKLLGQFADCLADQLSGGSAMAASPTGGSAASGEDHRSAAASRVGGAGRAIDLITSAGPTLAKRMTPVVLALVAVAVAVALVVLRRRH
jgi:carbon monoxide dehydrogenase subunit G